MSLGQIKLRQRQIFRSRDFQVIAASGDQLRMIAAVLQRRSLIGNVRAFTERAQQAVAQQPDRKQLRRQRVPQRFTFNGMIDIAAAAEWRASWCRVPALPECRQLYCWQ